MTTILKSAFASMSDAEVLWHHKQYSIRAGEMRQSLNNIIRHKIACEKEMDRRTAEARDGK